VLKDYLGVTGIGLGTEVKQLLLRVVDHRDSGGEHLGTQLIVDK
jgi:hypothetical protein